MKEEFYCPNRENSYGQIDIKAPLLLVNRPEVIMEVHLPSPRYRSRENAPQQWT
jgi:hypothetical protein